jgi:Tfp pilus assembly protein PilN
VLAAKQSLQAAMSSEVLWSNQLDTLRRELPDGVRLTTLTVTPIDTTASGSSSSASVQLPSPPAGSGQSSASSTTPAATNAGDIANVQISGVALDNPHVATFLDTLAGMAGWGDVYLTNTATKDPNNGIVTFSITANITQAALSHRYTNGS